MLQLYAFGIGVAIGVCLGIALCGAFILYFNYSGNSE